MNSQSNKIALKTGAINRRHQRSRKEESEFGKAGKEFIICPECDSVFFDKAWHHRLEEEKNAHLKIDRKIKFELCPACKMARDKLFEGELVISIKNKELSVKNNVLNVIGMKGTKLPPGNGIRWTEYCGQKKRRTAYTFLHPRTSLR